MQENTENIELKNKYFKLRVTESEREKLHALANAAGYKSTSQYMLDRALNPVMYVEDPSPFMNTNLHLGRIGTNINQIARKVHTRDFVLEEDLKEIKKLLLQQREYIKLLKEFRFFEKKRIDEIERLRENGDH